MQPIDPAEAIGAAIGLAEFIAEKPRRILKAEIDLSSHIDEHVAKNVKRFFEPGFERVRAQGALPGYDSLIERLSSVGDPEHLAEVQRLFFDNEALAPLFLEIGQKAVAYLNSIAPKSTRTTMVGKDLQKPGTLTLSRFKRAYHILCEPLSIIDRLCDGTLCTDEVDTVNAVFPTLLAAIKAAIYEETATRVAAKASFSFGFAKDNVLSTLVKISLLSPTLQSDLQKAFAPGVKPAPSSGAQPASKSPVDLSSASDAISRKL